MFQMMAMVALMIALRHWIALSIQMMTVVALMIALRTRSALSIQRLSRQALSLQTVSPPTSRRPILHLRRQRLPLTHPRP